VKELEILNKHHSLIVASNDAGAANIMAAFIEKHNLSKRATFILSGPAVVIFSNKFQNLNVLSFEELQKINIQDTLVLTGTSGWSELERNVLKWAKEHHITTVSFLDHWTNYIKRFIPGYNNNSELNFLDLLPDYVFVADDKAFEMAESLGFPPKKLVNIGNPYIAELRIEYLKISKQSTPGRILYMGEYFLGKNPEKNLSELNYVEDILKAIKEYFHGKYPNQFELYLRLHPQDNVEKYNYLLEFYPFLKIGVKINTLLEDIALSSLVLGKTSMGLVVSGEMGKQTYSFIHPEFNFMELSSKVNVVNSIEELLRLHFPK
jgi:hypothetical protein